MPESQATTATAAKYQNILTKLAVARILGDGIRQKTRAFSELDNDDPFADKFGRPAKGNDKGQSGRVGGVRTAELSGADSEGGQLGGVEPAVAGGVRERRARKLRGHQETIGERFERDRAAFLPLPNGEYEACEKRVSASEFHVAGAPSHQRLLGADRVWVSRCAGEGLRARGGDRLRQPGDRPPSAEVTQREDMVFDPLHYLALLEQKARALDQAAPLVGLGVAGSALPTCDGCWKHDGARAASGSTCRCCACWRHSLSRRSSGLSSMRLKSGYHQLRRRQAPAAVPHRAATTPAGSGELPASAAGRGADHAGG